MSAEVAVTDVLGSVIYGTLRDLAKCAWSDEAAEVGAFDAEVPVRSEDVAWISAVLAIDEGWRIAEVRNRNRAIHAYVIESLSTERGDDGELVWAVEGSGLLKLMEGLPILPETSEATGAPVDERIFGPGSLSPFVDLINWNDHKNLKRVGDNSMPGWDSLLWKPGAPRNGPYATKEQDLLDDGVPEEEAAERDGEYPDQDAYWIGPPAMSTDEDDMPFMAPPGTWWVRERFTLAEAADFVMLVTADEHYALFIDGVEMGATTGDVFQWRSWDGYEFGLPAGKHTIAVRVDVIQRPFGTEYRDSSTGLLYGVWKVADSDDPPDRLDDKTAFLRSGHTDPRVADIGQYTGWTPGEILLTLLDEAEGEATSRGDPTMPPMTLLPRDSFDLFLDSNGDPWEVRVDHAFSTMRSGGMEVIRKLAELGAEVTVDPDSRAILAYNVRGSDRTTGEQQIRLDRWRDMLDESFELTAGPVNSIRVRYRFGAIYVDEPDSISRFGRMWQPLQLGDALSRAQARQGGARALQDAANAAETAPIKTPDESPGPLPYDDYGPGDTIWVRNRAGDLIVQRVWAIAGELDDDAVVWETEVDEPLILAREPRNAKISHGLKLGNDATIHSKVALPVDVAHGLKLGNAGDVWSRAGPTEVEVLHGLKLGNAAEVSVNDPPGAEVTIAETT